MSERTNCAVLVARKDSEYYFVDSIFKHRDDFFGCTGMNVYPITEEMMEDLLSIDNLVERFGDYWEERFEGDVDPDCEDCDGWIDEEGCKSCGYPSVESFCNDIANHDGSDAVIDNAGYKCAEALDAVCEAKIEYADCTGCGRIFGNFGSDKPMSPDDFDEVYNMKALVACLAYEDGAVGYDYAVKAILGK